MQDRSSSHVEKVISDLRSRLVLSRRSALGVGSILLSRLGFAGLGLGAWRSVAQAAADAANGGTETHGLSTFGDLALPPDFTAFGYVNANAPQGAVIGVGTGSTANCFIDAIAASKDRYLGAVSSSVATTARLQSHGFRIFDLNDIESLPVYVDGADEIDAQGAMIKGGGGALTREKIVASVTDVFVCIADASKRVDVLGQFPLPIEVKQ